MDAQMDSEHQIYRIGGMRISLQALLVVVLSCLLAIVVIALSPSTGITIGILLFLLSMLILAYIINCMIVGQCNVFAWIISLIYVIYLLFALVSIGYMKHSGENIEELFEDITDGNIIKKLEGIYEKAKSAIKTVKGKIVSKSRSK